MRNLPDSPWGINPSPEEIALEGWLEDSGPYLTLSERGSDRGEETDDD